MKKYLIILNNFFLIPILIILFLKLSYDMFNNLLSVFYLPSIVFSWIIFVSLYLIFLGITGKSFTSNITVLVLLIIIFIINQIKLIYTGEPLFFSDFSFISNTSTITGFVKNSLIKTCLPYLKYLLVIIIGLFILSLYIKKFNIKIELLKNRVILTGIGIIILLCLLILPNFNKKIFLNLFFLGENKLDYNSFTNYKNVYSVYGIYGGMYNQYLDSLFIEPENYDEKTLNKILKKSSETKYKEKTLGTPNIIVILSESFFDVELLKEDIKFNKTITSSFNELKNKGQLVNVISPNYGGMTANVTFELLTGANNSYFHSGYIPFMQLYNDNRNDRPSIVNDLKNNGYYSEVILGQDSYDSSKVFYKLGFSNYTKLKVNKKNNKGYYVSDEYITKLLIEKLEKSKKEKNFYLIETMQSHMDYSIKKYDKYDIAIEETNLDTKDSNTLLSYAQGIYDADIMLKELYNYINTIEEETILIFFGDHLPYLQNVDGKNIIDKLSYFNTKDKKLNLYRKYNTQALILSNYDNNLELPNNLGFDMLLTNIVNNMDVELSTYYCWLYSEQNKLPAYNRYISIDNNNNINYLNDLKQESLNSYYLRNQMFYKLFIK